MPVRRRVAMVLSRFFFSSRRRHTIFKCDWSSDVCSSDLGREYAEFFYREALEGGLDVFGIDVLAFFGDDHVFLAAEELQMALGVEEAEVAGHEDRKSVV